MKAAEPPRGAPEQVNIGVNCMSPEIDMEACPANPISSMRDFAVRPARPEVLWSR